MEYNYYDCEMRGKAFAESNFQSHLSSYLLCIRLNAYETTFKPLAFKFPLYPEAQQEAYYLMTTSTSNISLAPIALC